MNKSILEYMEKASHYHLVCAHGKLSVVLLAEYKYKGINIDGERND